jgi:hypothetical protein
VIHLKLFPYGPELFFVLPLSRVTELAHMLVNGSSTVYFTKFTLHFCESEPHLDHLRTALHQASLNGTLKQLSGSTYSIILSCFGNLKVDDFVALINKARLAHFLGSTIINLHGMIEQAKVLLIVCMHVEKYFRVLGRRFCKNLLKEVSNSLNFGIGMSLDNGLQVSQPELMGIGPGVKHRRGQSSLKNTERMLELVGTLQKGSEIENCLRRGNFQIHHSFIGSLSIFIVS